MKKRVTFMVVFLMLFMSQCSKIQDKVFGEVTNQFPTRLHVVITTDAPGYQVYQESNLEYYNTPARITYDYECAYTEKEYYLYKNPEKRNFKMPTEGNVYDERSVTMRRGDNAQDRGYTVFIAERKILELCSAGEEAQREIEYKVFAECRDRCDDFFNRCLNDNSLAPDGNCSGAVYVCRLECQGQEKAENWHDYTDIERAKELREKTRPVYKRTGP